MTKQQLIDNIKQKKTFLCVGLDPDLNKIPKHLLSDPDPIFSFNKAVIDATAPYCVAYKPNVAFYECLGLKGWQTLEKTVKYIKNYYPGHFLIADAKRGDIGNTSRMYAKTFFEELDVDAVTVAPYMGEDSIKPFLDYPGKWVILLALTSNKGAYDFQFLEDKEGVPLFESVIVKSKQWGTPDNLMYVIGATKGAMMRKVRRLSEDFFWLVPGVGAQGGSLEEVARYGMTKDCCVLVNSSRGIIYASSGLDFAEAAAAEAQKLALEMALYINQ